MVFNNKIKSVVIEFFNGQNVDVTRNLNLPFSFEPVLDETLATAKIILSSLRQREFEQYGVRIDRPFETFTPVVITFEGQQTEIRMLVARDTAEMVRKDVPFQWWRHEVELVEETKNLERDKVDTLTFQNPLQREYDSKADAEFSISYLSDNFGADQDANNFFDQLWTPPEIGQLQKRGNIINISDNAETWWYNNGSPYTRKLEYLKLKIEFPSGRTEIYESPLNITGSAISGNLKYISSTYSLIIDQEGEYVLEFQFKYWYHSSEYIYLRQKTTIFVLDSQKRSPYTLSNVMDRLLSVTPLRQKDGTNKYTFAGSEGYSTEEAPEFSFTDNTLFEACLQVAQYKQSFPFLYKNQISFRPLWNGKTLKESSLPPAVRILRNSSIDQYCTNLDCTVENMVCINDVNVGTVIEPYAGGYISTRSSAGSEISETTAMIPTQSDIYQSLSLMMGETNGETVGDLKAYVYEQSDYDALYDTNLYYPYSKGYALKYTRMGRNYTELAHRIRSNNKMVEAFTRPALANIVRAKTGGDVGENLKSYIQDLLAKVSGNQLVFNRGASFADLLFQPSYTPVVNARVKQYKEYTGDFHYESTLCYNQTAELVDSELFGEHIKGMIQKLGNHTEVRVCEYARIDDVPKVGTIVNIDGREMSVYDTAMTIYETHVVVTLCLVEYAELSQYIGVKNKIKDSDISRDKCYNRYVNFEEFLIFTHDENVVGTGISITPEALLELMRFRSASPLTCAEGIGYTEDGAEISATLRPIKHLALGNSIYFQWDYENHFAAGYQSTEAPDGATSVWTGTLYNRAQKAVRYCDMYGRMETYDFKLLRSGPLPTNSRYEINIDNYDYTQTEEADEQGYAIHRITVNRGGAQPYAVEIEAYYGGYLAASVTIGKNESSASFTVDGRMGLGNLTFKGYVDGSELQRRLAHAYPLCPDEVRGQEWEQSPIFEVNDLLIKKNSAERLIFAAQYHFQRDIRDFIIGSGLTNFCSLIGGEARSIKLCLFHEKLNRNERHVSEGKIIESYDPPTITIEDEKKRVKIEFPKEFDELPSWFKSWALVGRDRNGNLQLIYGENRGSNDADFGKTLYLYTKKKEVV